MQSQYCWINQKGAGTGKTWSCVSILQKPLGDFTTYIYLSKMNTAKSVIKEEFISQYADEGVYFKEDIAEVFGNVVVVSTIDAMVYAFAEKKIRKYTKGNYYSELVYCFDINKPRFDTDEKVWNKIKIDKNTLVVIDECQDLEEGYIDIFMNSLATKGVSFYLVGDILQSVTEQRNIFKYIHDEKYKKPGFFPNMIFERIDNSDDKMIRFHSEKFIEFANTNVNFEKFGSFKIKRCCDSPETCGFVHDNEPYTLTENSEDNKDLINLLSDIVRKNNYEPQDLLFISPIIDSVIMYQLESKINDFWSEYYKDSNSFYNKYCILQTSKYGKIDLDFSAGRTRVLSVHASKGMGAKCVVVVNLTDRSLRSHQTRSGELKYESILHVALTRQKENLVMYYSGVNSDDRLVKRILSTNGLLPEHTPSRRCNIPVDKLYSELRNHVDLLNEFEGNNLIRSSVGRIGVDVNVGRLEPVDLKVHLLMNTMIQVLAKYDKKTRYEYQIPCVKRLTTFMFIEIIPSLTPRYYTNGSSTLEIQACNLTSSLIKIVDNIRKKIGTKEQFCYLEAHILAYMLQLISPFTLPKFGNIFHRMSRSTTQECRADYHPRNVCECLSILDKIVETKNNSDDRLFETCDVDDFEDDDMLLEMLNEIQEEVKEEKVNEISFMQCIPDVVPDKFAVAVLNQLTDTLDYKPNFTINLDISDFYMTQNNLCVVFTVPYLNYINFMDDITLPAMVYSYLLFKTNEKMSKLPSKIAPKNFFGMDKSTKKIDRIIFYINRLGCETKREMVVFRDDDIIKRMDSILLPVIRKEFSRYLQEWVKYYIHINNNMDVFTQQDIDSIVTTNKIKGIDILSEIKDIPSEIIGRVLDVIDNEAITTIVHNVIDKIINSFGENIYPIV